METKLQSDIIKWLKSHGAYVIKTKPQPGTPVGCPDILFLFEGAWGAIEVKAHSKSKFQPGQKETIKKLSDWSPFVYVATPDFWEEIRADLLKRFF